MQLITNQWVILIVCSAADCGNHDDPDPNGDVSYVATTLGNTANYSCDYGYLLDVSQGRPVVVTCLASGDWSNTAPAGACKVKWSL